MESTALRCSIDIGSNSINCLIAEYDSVSKVLQECYVESLVTELGRGVDATGNLQLDTMEASRNALETYCQKAKGFGIDPDRIIVTATEASRVASNASKFYNGIQSNLGLNVSIISGEKEAYFSALGASQGTTDEQILLLDIGGSSTEFVHAHLRDFKIKHSISLPFGSVRSTEWLSKGSFDTNFSKIWESMEGIESIFRGKKLLCVAGTMTSLFTMVLGGKVFSSELIHQKSAAIDQFDGFFREYSSSTGDKLLQEFPFLGKRSKAIMGGLYLASSIFGSLKTPEIICSTRGLRYGTLIDGGLSL
ncbi:MAG: hypothetical protein HOE90_08220 [Bacteriovoracaceae bacterium]|nr:hypothetical protein [Bacteriovoracaceae bacterium]